MNEFNIIGRLTADPTIKELDNGKKVVNVTLAVDKKYKDNDGNKITKFIPFTLWGKLAENIAKISKKGSLIHLSGSIDVKDIEIDGYRKTNIDLNVEYYEHLVLAKEESNSLENDSSKENVLT